MSKGGLFHRPPSPLSFREVTLILDSGGTEAVKEATFTDCVEISILRTLQTFLLDLDEPTQIDMPYFLEKVTNTDLMYFFNKYPQILSNSEQRKSAFGIQSRTEWAAMVSNRPGLVYFFNDFKEKVELWTSIENLIQFFKLFFPGIRSGDNVHDCVTAIGDYFSRERQHITCELRIEEPTTQAEGVVLKTENILISINGVECLKWVLTQVVEGEVGTGGHSQVYRM